MAKTIQDYKSGAKPIWCPGCGDFGILNALYRAFTDLQLEPHETVAVSGIGCSSRAPYFINSYGYHGIHGRALPAAMGIKIGNPDLNVVVMGGDGDGLAIGAAHFPHACRRNLDITYIMMDNFIYGLTKGQASPTTHQTKITKTTPEGPPEIPLDPSVFAITFGATFVARCFSAQPTVLADILVQAIQHKGFSFVQVLSPCTTFYDTYQLCRENTDALPEGSHDIHNQNEALQVAIQRDPVRLGILYKAENQPVRVQGKPLAERLGHRERLQEIDRMFARYA